MKSAPEEGGDGGDEPSATSRSYTATHSHSRPQSASQEYHHYSPTPDRYPH